MMHRFILLLCCTGILMMRSAIANESHSLLIWVSPDQPLAAWQALAQRSSTPQLTIQVQHPPRALLRFIQQRTDDQALPDILIWPHMQLQQWIDAGLLQTFKPSTALLQRTDPRAWRGLGLGDQFYAYPVWLEGPVMLSHTALPPAERASSRIALNATNSYLAYPWIPLNQLPIAPTQADDSVVALTQFQQWLQDYAHAYRDDNQALNAWLAQQHTHLLIASHHLAQIAHSPQAPLVSAYTTLGQLHRQPYYAVIAAYLPTLSTQQALAQSWLEQTLLSPPTLTQLQGQHLSGVPPYFDYLDTSPYLWQKPLLEAWLAGQPLPSHAQSPLIWATWNRVLTQMLVDPLSAQDTSTP